MTVPRIGRIAPQFLVDDLEAALAHYVDALGFGVDFSYEGFYAAVSRGETTIHLKCTPKTVADRELRSHMDHLDGYIVVHGVDALHEELVSRGARIISPVADRPWGCREFWAMDLDGYILAFSEPLA